jgi:basic amino acid/polyamine antiporter, APA family
MNPGGASPSAGPTDLKRALGLVDCVLLVVGGIIGSGIFLTPSAVARNVGSATTFLLVWVAGGILSFFGAMTFAELGSAFPKSGGLYVYLKEAYGSLPAFLYGWCVFFVIITGSIATLASAFSIYLNYLIPMGRLLQKGLPISLILLLTTVNCFGVRTGAALQNLLGCIKIGSLLAIVIVLFLSAKGTFHNFHGFSGHGSALSPGALGIAMIAVLWTYDGWHLLTYAAGEIKNPTRNVTLGLFFGMLIVIAVYSLANTAYLYMMPLKAMAGSSRVASDAVTGAIGSTGGTLVAIIILFSIMGAMNGNILGGPRVFYAMAGEGLFFKRLAFIHPKSLVPTVSIVATGIWASLLTLIGDFERLFSYVMFVSWIFFALGAGAVFVLRRKRPSLERPYKVKGYPWVPLVFILVAAAFVINALIYGFKNSIWGLLVMAAGLPGFFYWNRKRQAGEERLQATT